MRAQVRVVEKRRSVRRRGDKRGAKRWAERGE